jgi:hypothetical protein
MNTPTQTRQRRTPVQRLLDALHKTERSLHEAEGAALQAMPSYAMELLELRQQIYRLRREVEVKANNPGVIIKMPTPASAELPALNANDEPQPVA